MIVIGLTGNYGMGKSLVLKVFRELGARTLDADAIVGDLLKDKAVQEQLRHVLGNDTFDEQGRLMKHKVSEMIFRDESLRLSVEDILHPQVMKKIEEVIDSATEDILVVEAALIFERGYQDRYYKTIAVYADEETAIRRLEKKGVRREEALKRLFCQMPSKEKVRLSDFSIDNNGTVDETGKQARAIYEQLSSTKIEAAERP
jgi:dephospho-CoA kinase